MEQGLSHPPLIPAPYQRYARRRPEAWAAARERFESGESAASICRALGLSRSQLYQHAKREAWSRPDQLEPADLLAELMAEDDASAPLPDRSALIASAWRQAGRAVALGQIAEARAWTRLVRDLSQLPSLPHLRPAPDAVSETRSS